MAVGIGARLLAKFMRRAGSRSEKSHPAAAGMPAIEGVSVSERMVETRAGAVRVLWYEPERPEGGESRLPVFISMHGGGFILGSADGDDYRCRAFASHVGCAVANIDYALAPERPYPAALHQCYDVAAWIVRSAAELGADPLRIAIGGHSAGGNLAAAACLMAKAAGGPSFVLQILDYPPLDIAKDPFSKTRYPEGSPIIPPKMARLFNACYVPPEEAADPLVSPVYAGDLSGLPPALVITAEQDSLAEEGELYASMLEKAGVAVRARRFEGVPHAFNFADGPASRESWELMEEELRRAFA